MPHLSAVAMLIFLKRKAVSNMRDCIFFSDVGIMLKIKKKVYNISGMPVTVNHILLLFLIGYEVVLFLLCVIFLYY